MIYQRVIKYCKENNLSVSAFEKKCCIGNGTISAWKDGSKPSLNTLEKIENATGIPIEELIKAQRELQEV